MTSPDPERGPHPSWSDPARDLSVSGCSHGYGWADACPWCRPRVDYGRRDGSRGDTLEMVLVLALALGAILAVALWLA